MAIDVSGNYPESELPDIVKKATVILAGQGLLDIAGNTLG